jgi:tetratricopeptide (TPR) repeat protein
MVRPLEVFVEKGPFWDKAQKAFAANDYERMITALKRLISMDSDDHAARLDFASALAATGDYTGALKTFKAIRNTFAGDPDYHVDLGRVHLALNDRDSALNEMALALEAEPECQGAIDAMAQMGILAVAEYLNGRRAEVAAKVEEKALAERAALLKENARAQAASAALEKARLEALAKFKSASDPTDTPPRLQDGIDPPKASSGMRDDPIDTAVLPELSARQRQKMMDRGQKAVAEKAAKMRENSHIEGSTQEKGLTGAAQDEALFALVDLEPEGPAQEKVSTGAAFDKVFVRAKEKVTNPLSSSRGLISVDEAIAKTKEKVARAEATRAEEAAKELALAEATAETEAHDGGDVKAKEMALADAIANTKEKVANTKEKALAEAAANAREKALRVRKVILLVTALILAITLAILGKRMLFY